MSVQACEVKLLRRDLECVWLLVNTAMDAWSEQAAVFIDEIRRLGRELTKYKERCRSLEAENKDLKATVHPSPLLLLGVSGSPP